MTEYQKLDPEFKTQWLAALRSGEYPQTDGFLHTLNGYCCLGVAYVLKGGRFEDKLKSCEIYVPLDNSCGDPWCSMPTDTTLEKWGLDVGAAELLTKMNDDHKSFTEIADWIERNL
jgi:hypothetical protein